MLRKCIEVVRLRRGGECYIRNLSGTASANFVITPVSKQVQLWDGLFFYPMNNIDYFERWIC